MSWLRDLPIRKKLSLVIVLSCSVVLLLACSILVIYQVINFRQNMALNSTVLADVLAKNTQAALTFQDEGGAPQPLDALQAQPSVITACLYNSEGERFATYARSGAEDSIPAHPLSDGHY